MRRVGSTNVAISEQSGRITSDLPVSCLAQCVWATDPSTLLYGFGNCRTLVERLMGAGVVVLTEPLG